MSNPQTNKEFLLKRWQSLRFYNVVILCAFFFFYVIGTLQSYSFFAPPAVFNLPPALPMAAILLSAYLIHCLIAKKDQKSIALIPILSLFTTLFITISSHFETATSQNSFLYFTLLLPLFYAYILSYNFQLLLINNFIVIVSYSFTAIIGETSSLVFILNILFLITLILLTMYSHIKNNTYTSKSSMVNRHRGPTLNKKNSLYLKSIIHDIRQPLSSLSLYTHLLEKRLKGKADNELINNVRGTSAQLERWISSLLELATLDSKSQKVSIKNIPLNTCLCNVIAKQQAVANSQNMSIKTRLPKATLHTDSKLLSEIIDNLLSNALLHGDKKVGGHILLSARSVKDNINLQVWNKGPRIQQSHLQSLFNELYYSRNPNHNKSKGIGLGLPLSQRKALLLNSKIEVTTSNNGSCFSIKIAKATKTEKQKNDFSNNIIRSKNNSQILLIDDDKSILTALSMLLENWGYKVCGCVSSQEAIEALNNQTFAIIISDYRLPGDKNGIDLIKVAKEKQGIPSLLLTGEVDPDKLKEGEFRDYKILHKPIKPAALRLLLRQLIN